MFSSCINAVYSNGEKSRHRCVRRRLFFAPAAAGGFFFIEEIPAAADFFHTALAPVSPWPRRSCGLAPKAEKPSGVPVCSPFARPKGRQVHGQVSVWKNNR